MHEQHTPFHVAPKYQWRFRELGEADHIYASVLSHADGRIGEVLDTLGLAGVKLPDSHVPDGLGQVSALMGNLSAWKASLPAGPDPQCLSSTRGNRHD
jgi:hypothetical protein